MNTNGNTKHYLLPKVALPKETKNCLKLSYVSLYLFQSNMYFKGIEVKMSICKLNSSTKDLAVLYVVIEDVLQAL